MAHRQAEPPLGTVVLPIVLVAASVAGCLEGSPPGINVLPDVPATAIVHIEDVGLAPPWHRFGFGPTLMAGAWAPGEYRWDFHGAEKALGPSGRPISVSTLSPIGRSGSEPATGVFDADSGAIVGFRMIDGSQSYPRIAGYGWQLEVTAPFLPMYLLRQGAGESGVTEWMGFEAVWAWSGHDLTVEVIANRPFWLDYQFSGSVFPDQVKIRFEDGSTGTIWAARTVAQDGTAVPATSPAWWTSGPEPRRNDAPVPWDSEPSAFGMPLHDAWSYARDCDPLIDLGCDADVKRSIGAPDVGVEAASYHLDPLAPSATWRLAAHSPIDERVHEFTVQGWYDPSGTLDDPAGFQSRAGLTWETLVTRGFEGSTTVALTAAWETCASAIGALERPDEVRLFWPDVIDMLGELSRPTPLLECQDEADAFAIVDLATGMLLRSAGPG